MAVDNGSGVGMTLRQMVFEIRGDVKDLALKLDRIDREGSIGTKAELNDHEQRIRKNETWRYAIPPTIIIALIGSFSPAILHFILR